MKNKGFLLASSVGLALVPAVGQAADMAIKAPPPVAPPPPLWTGFYLGINGGAAWAHATASIDFDGFPVTREREKTTGLFGGQIGYNWQNGNALWGFEADASWTGNNHADDGCHGYCGGANRVGWIGTVRGRMGLAVNNALAYVTGGVAFAGVKNQFLGKSESKTRVGWTIGGGVDYMFSRNWIFGMEALFVDFGKKTVDPFGSGKGTTFAAQAIIGRLKLNYKF
jgi:outer membrane immunogenic protein